MVYFKKILLCFLTAFIFMGSCVFGFTEQSTDLNNNSATYIMSKYEGLSATFVEFADRCVDDDSIMQECVNFIYNGRRDYYFYYSNRTMSDGTSLPNNAVLNVLIYSVSNSLSGATNSYNLGYYNVQTECIKLDNPNYYRHYRFTRSADGSITSEMVGNSTDSPISSPSWVVPYVLYGYRSPYVSQWVLEYKNGGANSDVVGAINQMQEALTSTDTTADDDNNIQSGIDFDTGTADVTQGGFNSIFNKFYNGITEEPRQIVVPIPYANTSFTIDPNWTANALGSNSWIVTTINSLWFCLVGLYIYKDVQKLIEKVQNGSIANSSDTNIKTEML